MSTPIYSLVPALSDATPVIMGLSRLDLHESIGLYKDRIQALAATCMSALRSMQDFANELKRKTEDQTPEIHAIGDLISISNVDLALVQVIIKNEITKAVDACSKHSAFQSLFLDNLIELFVQSTSFIQRPLLTDSELLTFVTKYITLKHFFQNLSPEIWCNGLKARLQWRFSLYETQIRSAVEHYFAHHPEIEKSIQESKSLLSSALETLFSWIPMAYGREDKLSLYMHIHALKPAPSLPLQRSLEANSETYLPMKSIEFPHPPLPEEFTKLHHQFKQRLLQLKTECIALQAICTNYIRSMDDSKGHPILTAMTHAKISVLEEYFKTSPNHPESASDKAELKRKMQDKAMQVETRLRPVRQRMESMIAFLSTDEISISDDVLLENVRLFIDLHTFLQKEPLYLCCPKHKTEQGILQQRFEQALSLRAKAYFQKHPTIASGSSLLLYLDPIHYAKKLITAVQTNVAEQLPT